MHTCSYATRCAPSAGAAAEQWLGHGFALRGDEPPAPRAPCTRRKHVYRVDRPLTASDAVAGQRRLGHDKSNTFLGSQGEAFGDRLSQQRPNMDAAVEAFFQQRDQIDAALLGSTIGLQLVAIEQR